MRLSVLGHGHVRRSSTCRRTGRACTCATGVSWCGWTARMFGGIGLVSLGACERACTRPTCGARVLGRSRALGTRRRRYRRHRCTPEPSMRIRGGGSVPSQGPGKIWPKALKFTLSGSSCGGPSPDSSLLAVIEAASIPSASSKMGATHTDSAIFNANKSDMISILQLRYKYTCWCGRLRRLSAGPFYGSGSDACRCQRRACQPQRGHRRGPRHRHALRPSFSFACPIRLRCLRPCP